MRVRPQLAVVVVSAAFLLAACGGNDGESGGAKEQSSASPPAAGQQAELEHIHGLAIDPGSGTLYVATHYGLFAASKGQTKLERMGASRQDIMGFSIIGARRFIGSGHPDPSQNLPPNLGLIESRDDGRSWRNVSLLGKADFHVLRSAGQQVYGFDSGSGRMMVSTNRGRSWGTRTPPAGMFDLAIDPRADRRIVVSTERGVFASPNAGKGWRPLRDDVAGLLAWPAPDRLFLVDAQGGVSRSRNAGRSFDHVGSIGSQPAAFVSAGNDLYAATGDGNVVRSTDAGASWAVRATP